MTTPGAVTARTTITNRLGLHARAAAKLARTAAAFAADTRLWKGGEWADAKSVLDLISLGCPVGTEVAITAEGPDAPAAAAAAIALVNDKFGEE